MKSESKNNCQRIIFTTKCNKKRQKNHFDGKKTRMHSENTVYSQRSFWRKKVVRFINLSGWWRFPYWLRLKGYSFNWLADFRFKFKINLSLNSLTFRLDTEKISPIGWLSIQAWMKYSSWLTFSLSWMKFAGCLTFCINLKRIFSTDWLLA